MLQSLRCFCSSSYLCAAVQFKILPYLQNSDNWYIGILQTLKWELVDMGSLNGTFLNSQSVHHPNAQSRHWGEPAELAHGDIITLGTSSKLSVSS